MTALDNLSPERRVRFNILSEKQKERTELPDDELRELISLVQELRRTTSGPAKPRSSKKKAASISLADL